MIAAPSAGAAAVLLMLVMQAALAISIVRTMIRISALP
jgi:hypothetical protein